eukprot:1040123-Prymnesium_polylepis.2
MSGWLVSATYAHTHNVTPTKAHDCDTFSPRWLSLPACFLTPVDSSGVRIGFKRDKHRQLEQVPRTAHPPVVPRLQPDAVILGAVELSAARRRLIVEQLFVQRMRTA